MKQSEHQETGIDAVRSMGEYLSLVASPTYDDHKEQGNESTADESTSEERTQENTSTELQNTNAQNNSVSNGDYVSSTNGNSQRNAVNPTPASQATEETEDREVEETGNYQQSTAGDDDSNADDSNDEDDDGMSLSEVYEFATQFVERVRQLYEQVTSSELDQETPQNPQQDNPQDTAPLDLPEMQEVSNQGGGGPQDAFFEPTKSEENPPSPVSYAEVPLDDLIDPYMKINWNREQYNEFTQRYNVNPPGVGTVMEQLLPPGTPEEVVQSANYVYNFGANMLDIGFLSIVAGLPVVSMIGGPIYAIRDAINSAAEVPELEDSYLDEGIIALEVLRGVCDVGQSFIGGIESTVNFLQWLAAGALGSIGVAIAGALGTAAGPAGTAAGSTGGGATGVGVATTAGASTQAFIINAQAFLNGMMLGADLAITITSILARNEAARNGHMGQAEAFGDIAKSRAIRSIGDVINIAIMIGSEVASAGYAPSNLLREGGEEATQRLLRNLDGQFSEELIDGFVDGTISTFFGKTGELDVGNVLNSLINPTILGADTPYIVAPELSGSGDQSESLQQARNETIELINQSWENLQSDDPKWHQELLNEILAPKEDGMGSLLNKLMLPSGWLELGLLKSREFSLVIVDMLLNHDADLLLNYANQLEGPVENSVNWIIQTIAENTDIEEEVHQLQEILEEQEVTIQFLRDGLEQFESAFEAINEVMDVGSDLESSCDGMISNLEEMRLTRENLNLPDIVPDSVISMITSPYNLLIDEQISRIRLLKLLINSIITQPIAAFKELVQKKINEISDVIQENGELEQMFREAKDQVVQNVNRWLQFVADFFEGEITVDFSGFADLIRSISAQLQEATNEFRYAEFLEAVGTEGTASVAEWKLLHTQEVDLAFYPEIPQNEVEALTTAYNHLINSLQSSENANQNADAIARAEQCYATAMGFVGQKGSNAIHGFWAAVDELANINTSN